jgi:capsular polysaccharide biosynthesis protein
MQLKEFINIIAKNRLYIVFTTITTVIIVQILTFFQVPEYKSVALLLVESITNTYMLYSPDKNNIHKLVIRPVKHSYTGHTIDAAILNSKFVENKLYKYCNLNYSEAEFRRNLEVQGYGLPYIAVRYKARSPEEILHVIENLKIVYFNILTDYYLDYQKKNKSIIEKEIAITRKEQDTGFLNVKNKEQEYYLIDPETHLKEDYSKLNYFKLQLEGNEQNHNSAISRYNKIIEVLKVVNIDQAIYLSFISENLPYILKSLEISMLKISLIKLQSRYTNNHNQVIETKNRIDKLEKSLYEEYKGLKKFKKSGQKDSLPALFSPAKLQLTIELIKTRLEIIESLTKIEFYSMLSENTLTDLLNNIDKRHEITKLQRESDLVSAKLLILLNILTAQDLDIGRQKARYLIYELEEPFIKKIKPNYSGNFLYALLLGLLLGCLQAVVYEKILMI